VGAIVIDTGSLYTKIGYAGDSEPKVIVPTTLCRAPLKSEEEGMDVDEDKTGQPKEQSYFIDANMNCAHENMDAICPVKIGIIEDWDAITYLWKSSIIDTMHEDILDHPLLFTEPPWNPLKNREKHCEIIFEDLGTSSAYLAKDAVLATFCLGKTTALVIDSGGDSTRCVPVQDGYVLKRPIRRTKCAGRFLQHQLQKHVQETYGENVLKPMFSIQRHRKDDGTIVAVDKNLSGVLPSYMAYMRSEIVRGMKEAVFILAHATPSNSNTRKNILEVDYELPDGKLITIGEQRQSIPEVMFARFNHDLQDDIDFKKNCFEGLHLMIQGTINNCDADIRRDLYNNLILCGGNSNIKGLEKRLAHEVCNIAPPAFSPKIVLGPGGTFNRQNCIWIGGSILGSLGFFQEMWVTKAQYEEDGSNIVLRKLS